MCSNSAFLVDSGFLDNDSCLRLQSNAEWGRSTIVAADNLPLALDYLHEKILNSWKVIEQKSLLSHNAQALMIF